MLRGSAASCGFLNKAFEKAVAESAKVAIENGEFACEMA